MYLQISPVSGRWCVRLGLVGAIVGSAMALGSPALAQVVADPTVGSSVSGVSGGEQTITGGTRQGGNLFHSFQQFSVPTNGAAIFNNALDIQNILSRVTGGSVSDIDGLIQANGAANLFLLNPNGIIFGQNARLNIGGSFIATTASSINFADGTQFSATPGTGAPLLTVSVPLGLQFGTNPGNIINRSRAADSNNFIVGLQVQPEKTLGLIGGNVNMEGSRLTARGGRIELGAVAAPGVVGINPDPSGFRFSFPTDLTFGDISLTNLSVVDVAADRGGSIATNSQNLSLAQGSNMGAGIRSGFGLPDSKAGNIEIHATGRIALADGSFITNSVQRGAVGNSGDLNVTAGTLELIGGGQLEASTYGKGNAGNMNINASSITFSGVINQRTSGILSNVEDGANGTGGIINIKADSLSLTDGGQIQAIVRSTSDTLPGGNGNAGKVVIDIRNSFDISGINGEYSSAVFTFVGSGAEGKGGDIDIKTRSLDLTDRGYISADTFGQGDAGSISIAANDRIFLGGSQVSSIVGSTGVGKGGDINIKARSLSLTEGAQINTSTYGQGNAGNIELVATDPIDSIFISRNSFVATSSYSTTGNAGNITIDTEGKVAMDGDSQVTSSLQQIQETPQLARRSGDIRLKARSLFLSSGALLGASTFSRGDAGNVTLDISDTLSIEGVGAGNFQSGVFSNVQNNGIGKNGNIEIATGSLLLKERGIITARTLSGEGDAGSITITASGNVLLDGGFISSGYFGGTSLRQGNPKGGDINVKARSLSLIKGAEVDASTFGIGNAGNIVLQVDDLLSLSNSSIFSSVAPGGVGDGGKIEIKAGTLSLTEGAQVVAAIYGSASGLLGGRGNSGKVIVDVRDTFSASGSNSLGNPSAVFTAVGAGAVGNGGDINIKARSLFLSNSGQLNSSSAGQGDAGNIDVNVRSLALNYGGIFAQSLFTGNGGDIELRASKSVRLRNGSQISTSAGGTEQGGNGGNITINSPLVIANANGNNDITANAFRGSGGRIEINAQGIFGLTRIDGETLPSLLGTNTPSTEVFERVLNELSSNDVAAISLTDPSLSGTVSFNAADIDPSRDIVELPTGLVDASSLVAAGCPSGAENRFTVAGRGGLPPAPADKLSPDALLTDWATLQTPETENRAAVETTTSAVTNTTPTTPVETITEATSWQYDRNGAIILTSSDTTSPHHLKATPTSCSSS